MSTNKTIWLINFYASTLTTGIGGRCYYFAKSLAELGYDVYLFSASDHHLLIDKPNVSWLKGFACEKVDGFNYVWLKTPTYANAHSKVRLLSEFYFSQKIKQLSKSDFSKPSTIFYSSPGLIPSLGAQSLAKNLNAKLILDIRDLWPLTLIEMGGYSPKHPLVAYMQMIENSAYKNADAITSNWPYAINYMIEHNASPEKFSWIPNGFSIDEFSNPEAIDSKTLARFPKEKFIIGYAGTLGKANALDALLDSAEILKSNKNIAFVIVGKGRESNDLISQIKSRNLYNVHYVGSVPKRAIPNVLSLFDVCYVGFLDIPLYRFGSSLTKLPEYLASKKPIVYASNSPFQPISNCKAGITVQAENSKEIAEAISQLYNMTSNERNHMGILGYKEAMNTYEYGSLSKKLARLLFDG